ncbi:TRAP transporter small permease subunit, partial [Achromobacter sp. SIMBA_011]|uniref:TRAP transporter small permease subunit n=1 Tax=Achromobacter sp. SIMBA_011 TaxID=3085759 RepID=UPI00397D30B2
MTFFLDMLPPSLAGYVRRLADLAMLSFLAYATILSFEMTIQGASRPSVALRLPYALLYMSTLISFGVMFITALLRFVGAIPEPQ